MASGPAYPRSLVTTLERRLHFGRPYLHPHLSSLPLQLPCPHRHHVYGPAHLRLGPHALNGLRRAHLPGDRAPAPAAPVGHFATCARFFTPAQKTGGRALTSREIMWNEWLQLERSRVEHINTVIKNHRMFKGEPYRGWVRNLKIFVRISLHGAAAELRHRAQRDGDRYPGFGPWAH